jgi:hypothetical protein
MKQLITCKGFEQMGQLGPSAPEQPSYAPLRGPIFSSASSPGTVNTWPFTHPWSVAGTFKNFYVEIFHIVEDPVMNGWPDIDFEVYINDAPTGLIVTVPTQPSDPTPGAVLASGQNITDTATIAPGDVISISRGPGTIAPGFNNQVPFFGWTLTFESDNDGESGYGMSSCLQGPLHAVNQLYSAPFNTPTGLTIASSGDVATTSIVPMACTLFRLDVRLDTAPGMGKQRVLAAELNGVVQDGTGGTIDTQVAVTDLNLTASGTFALPMAVLDKFSIVQIVASGPSAADARVTYSIGVRADDDGQSALGFYASGNPINDGSTDYCGGIDGGWAWTTARAPTPSTLPAGARWPLSESSMSIPGPIDSYALTNLCCYLSDAPGTGNSRLFTTRRAVGSTPGTLLMTDSTRLDVGSTSAGTYHGVTDRMDLQAVGDSLPNATTVSWTWLVVESTTPPIVSTSYPIRRLRRFALPFAQNKWIRISRVELIKQAGKGLSGTAATVQGYNPIVMFRLSRDGGATWDDELTMETGKIGEYTARAFLNMLGRARNPVVELTSSDPVFVSWIDFTVDYDEGTS